MMPTKVYCTDTIKQMSDIKGDIGELVRKIKETPTEVNIEGKDAEYITLLEERKETLEESAYIKDENLIYDGVELLFLEEIVSGKKVNPAEMISNILSKFRNKLELDNMHDCLYLRNLLTSFYDVLIKYSKCAQYNAEELRIELDKPLSHLSS